jgi:hypothetical protein
VRNQVITNVSRRLAGVALCACLLAPTWAKANVILPTLPPGSKYELVFATSGEVTGGSSNIGAYNAFATSQAASLAALLPAGVTWNAVVSTGTAAADEAVNNAPSSASIPIYNVLGTEISAGNLYSGTLLAPIDFTQAGGTPPTTQIWTGSSTSGTSLNPLGGPSDPEYGLYNSSGASWIASANNLSAGIGWPIYVLSSPITVVPEPGTLSLMAVALLCGAGAVLQRRRKSAACDTL